MGYTKSLIIDDNSRVEDQFRFKIIDYSTPSLSSAKDGGGVDLDEIQGYTPTNSRIFKGGTGKLEVMFYGTSEANCRRNFSKFASFCRRADFRRFISDEDPEYFREVKVNGSTEPNITHAVDQVYMSVTFNLLFKDAFKYKTRPTIVESKTNWAPGQAMAKLVAYKFTDISMKGFNLDNFRLEIDFDAKTSSTSPYAVLGETTYFALMFVDLDKRRREGLSTTIWNPFDFSLADGRFMQLRSAINSWLPEQGRLILRQDYPWGIDMNTKSIFTGLQDTKGVTYNMVRYFERGKFFSLEEGNYGLAFVVECATEANAITSTQNRTFIAKITYHEREWA